MKPKRVKLSSKVRNAVLSEFDHRCAICGASKPQFHHIDGDPSNNSEENLLPLCPNHHLTDQHRPTKRHSPEKLRLFRRYKDPFILYPQFEPIFQRMGFLYSLGSATQVDVLSSYKDDLLRFINELEMGGYYSERVYAMLEPLPQIMSAFSEVDRESLIKHEDEMESFRVRSVSKIEGLRPEIERLIVEMLRFQRWPREDQDHRTA